MIAIIITNFITAVNSITIIITITGTGIISDSTDTRSQIRATVLFSTGHRIGGTIC